MNMCYALGKKHNVVLLSRKLNKSITEIFEFYNLDKTFKIKSAPVTLKSHWLNHLFFTLFAVTNTLLQLNKFDVIYTRDSLLAYLLSPLRLFGKKVIFEIHSPVETQFRKRNKLYRNVNAPNQLMIRLKKEIERGALKGATSIVVITKIMKRDLIKRGIRAEKIIYFPDGVNIEQTYRIAENKKILRKKLKLPQNKRIVLYIGQFYPWKGVDFLVEVAKKTRKTHFVLMGGVKGEKDLARVKSKARGLKNITFTGFISDKRIQQQYLKAADYTIIPSTKNEMSMRYSSPMKLFEYMASGTPLITTDLPAIREIANNKNAIIVPPENIREMIRAIEETAPSTAKKKAEQAKKDVLKYTWDKRAEFIMREICKH